MIAALILLLFLVAIAGGFYVHPILFALLLLAIVLLFVGPVEGGGWGRRRW